jgi:hypothetical protein
MQKFGKPRKNNRPTGGGNADLPAPIPGRRPRYQADLTRQLPYEP